MGNTLVAYHSVDADGHLSGFLAGLAMEAQGFTVDYKPVNYPDKFKLDDYLEYDEVIIVDFSFKPEEMRQLHETTKLTQIDHHQRTNEQTDALCASNPIPGIRRPGLGACALVAEYFADYLGGWTPTCLPVRLTSEYDTFAKVDHPRWLTSWVAFNLGLRLHETDPSTEAGRAFWQEGLNVGKAIDEGNTIIRYQQGQAKHLLKNSAYRAKIEGYDALIINTASFPNLSLIHI